MAPLPCTQVVISFNTTWTEETTASSGHSSLLEIDYPAHIVCVLPHRVHYEFVAMKQGDAWVLFGAALSSTVFKGGDGCSVTIIMSVWKESSNSMRQEDLSFDGGYVQVLALSPFSSFSLCALTRPTKSRILNRLLIMTFLHWENGAYLCRSSQSWPIMLLLCIRARTANCSNMISTSRNNKGCFSIIEHLHRKSDTEGVLVQPYNPKLNSKVQNNKIYVPDQAYSPYLTH
jgi:hypothetical protein